MDDLRAVQPTFGVLILAGGRSSRMGTDKASLPYRGVTLLQHMRRLAAKAGAAPVLVGGGPTADIPDVTPGAGPVAGLCALAAFVSATAAPRRWLVLPVDTPRLGQSVLNRLVSGTGAVYMTGSPLPLGLSLDRAARDVLDRASRRLAAGESISVRDILASLGAVALKLEKNEQDQLLNANTPEDWRRLVEETGGNA